MPRSARIAPGGLVYHVLNRAAGRFKLFCTDKDSLAFEKTLIESLEREPGVQLLGWCVMSNHWHPMLWPLRDFSEILIHNSSIGRASPIQK